MTHDPMRPPAASSIAAHVERATQARTEQPAEEAPTGKSTAQVYAERVLPGYAADEELRERVRQQDMVARGILAAEVEAVEEDDEPEVIEPEEKPQRTSDFYARRALAAHSAEAASARVAQHNVALHNRPDPWSAA